MSLTLEKSIGAKKHGPKNGALSVCEALWQLPRCGASVHGMRRVFPAAVAAIVLTAAAPPSPPPVPGGPIGTLALGRYSCELPGDASGPIRIDAADYNFTIVHGSSYRAGGQRGSYLLTGDLVQMTSGTLKGLKLRRISGGFLRRIDEAGRNSELRCVRGTPGNS